MAPLRSAKTASAGGTGHDSYAGEGYYPDRCDMRSCGGSAGKRIIPVGMVEDR